MSQSQAEALGNRLLSQDVIVTPEPCHKWADKIFVIRTYNRKRDGRHTPY